MKCGMVPPPRPLGSLKYRRNSSFRLSPPYNLVFEIRTILAGAHFPSELGQKSHDFLLRPAHRTRNEQDDPLCVLLQPDPDKLPALS